MSKTIKIITEFEVKDDFDNYEGLVNYVSGTFDNAPFPEEVDDYLKDVEIVVSYLYR